MMNTVRVGSTWRIARRTPACQSSIVSVAAVESARRLRKVVIADDEEEIRNLLAEYLQTHGWDTFRAANGLELAFEQNVADHPLRARDRL